MKILVVAESIDVEDSSGTKGRVALLKNLRKAGYDLRVYHYTKKNIQLEDIPCFSIDENRRSLLFLASRAERYIRDYAKIKLHGPLQKIYGFSFTLYNDRNSIIAALKTIKDFQPDLILTLSKGGSFRPHHALLKIPEWHHKWMAYMHDPYPMHHYPKPFTWFEPGYKKKEKFVRLISEKAAFSAFPSLKLMQWMGQFYPDFLKGFIIPHQITEIAGNKKVSASYFDPGKFNILHAGNLLGARNPEVLVNSFLKFLKKHSDAKLVAKLIFLGGHNERVEKVASKYENIYSSRGNVSFREVLKMQQQTSVNIILEAKSDISPFLPGKFPHCVSAEKPILLLGPSQSEVRRLLGEKYPWWSEIDDEEKITCLIEDLYVKWKESPGGLSWKRPDLQYYLSELHLKDVMEEVKAKLS